MANDTLEPSMQHGGTPAADSPFKQAFKKGLDLPISPVPGTAGNDGDPGDIAAPPSIPKPAEPSAPPKPVAAPVPSQDAADMPPEIKSDQGKKDWLAWKKEHDVLKTDRETIAQERDRLKQELATAQAARNPDAEEVKTLREQLEESRVKLRMKDVEADPEWHNTFVRPVKAAIDQAKSLVPEAIQKSVEKALNAGDMDTLEKVLEESGLSTVRVSSIANLAAQIMQIRGAAELRKQDAGKLVQDYDAHMTARQEQQARQTRQQAEGIFTGRQRELAKVDPIFGDPEVSKAAHGVLFGPNTPEELADHAHYAALGRRASTELATVKAENAKLTAELARLTAGRPSVGAANGSGGDGGGAPTSEKTFTSEAKRMIRGGA